MTSVHTVVGSAHLIKKIYFPREVLPLSAVLANLVNFLLAMTVLFAMMFVFKTPFTVWALLLPVIIFVQMIFTVGLAFLLSTINVFYRDTAAIMDVAMLAWFFVTPVFYPITILPHYRSLFGFALDIQRLAYIMNPMASLIASYRVILYHGAPPALDFLFRTFVTAIAFLVMGYLFFLRYSRVFGEEL